MCLPDRQTQFDQKGGITIFAYGTNAVLSTLVIEDACIPVVLPNGTLMKQFGGCAPPGAEGHPRHPHGIDIDDANKIAWQVIEHSGLEWNATRTSFSRARTTDRESGLLVAYDISDLANPKILRGYVTGHAAEEPAVQPVNHKVYVGNHEPSPTNVPCFVSVIDPSAARPYKFIDLPGNQCVQGVWARPGVEHGEWHHARRRENVHLQQRQRHRSPTSSTSVRHSTRTWPACRRISGSRSRRVGCSTSTT